MGERACVRLDGASQVSTRLLRHALVTMLFITIAACDFVTRDIEQAWQRNFSESLVPAYSRFRGIAFSSDVAWYIYSYRYPEDVSAVTVMSKLKEQVRDSRRMKSPSEGEHAKSCFRVELETPVELQVRCNDGPGDFNEWHFLIDSEQHRVTVLYASIDSSEEREIYPELLNRFRRAHADLR